MLIQIVPVMDLRNTYGGPSTVAAEIAAELHRRQTKTQLWSQWSKPNGPWESDTTDHLQFRGGMLIQRKPATTVSFGLLRALLCRARKTDQVIIHGTRDISSMSAMALCSLRRIPYAVLTHGTLQSAENLHGLWSDQAFRYLRRARTVFALTGAEADSLRTQRHLSNVHVLRNGVTNEKPENPTLRSVDLAFVARLHPRKGFRAFDAAMRAIMERGRRPSVVIAGADEGDGAYAKALAADFPDSIRYVGAVPHAKAREVIASARVLVAPADAEPYGMTVIEAFLAGTAVIISDGFALGPEWAQFGAAEIYRLSDEPLERTILRMLDSPELLATRANAGRNWINSATTIEYMVDVIVGRQKS